MVQVITDANFEVETQEGVVLVDFGHHGVVLVVCKHQFWSNWQMKWTKMNCVFTRWMLMKIQTQLVSLESCLSQLFCSKRWTGCETSCWCPHERSNQSYLGRDWLIENVNK